MKHKWEVFKKKRTQKHFEKLPSQGFITMQQREGMIDKIFEILENGIVFSLALNSPGCVIVTVDSLIVSL
jgi:hypothetical protein